MRVQAGLRMQAARWATLCLPVLISACSGASYNPGTWWHNLEGGKIAEQRPPPPGANAPYPNLATVPPRPQPPDKAAMEKLTESLVADRANAHYSAESVPLPDPSSPRSSPVLFGVGSAPPPPPPGPPAASATLAAVSAPPAPAASVAPAGPASSGGTVQPPAKAPVKAVQSAPLEGQAPLSPQQPAAIQAAASPATAGPFAAMPAPSQMPPPPAMPTQPPPAATVAGGPPPPPAPPAPSPMPAPAGGPSTTLEFPPGSASLSPQTAEAVKRFAAARGTATILVTGYGDAEATSTNAQTVALSLALSRAQAVANALGTDGVPSGAVRVGAEASGRGAALRLLH